MARALTGPARNPADATALAEEAVAGIQGAIVLARALDDPAAFGRVIAALRGRLGVA